MRRPGLHVLAATVLLGVNLRTVVASLPPLLADVRADLELSATVAGLLTTLPVALFGALALVGPRLARRVPLERILVACLLATAAGAALRGLGTMPALFAGSLIAGAAIGLAQVAMPVLVRLAFPNATGLLTGAYSMALPLGATVAGGASVPLAQSLDYSWSASLAAWALPALLGAALWLPVALRGRTLVRGPVPAPLRGDALAWWVAGLMGVQSMAFYAGLAWLPEILQGSGWSAEEAGALQALNALISIPPAFLVPVLAARRPAQTPLLVAAVALAVAGVLGLLLAPGAALVWMLLVGLGQGGTLGLALILPVLRAGPGAVASLTAMMLCVGYLMASISPWMLGAAHDLSGGWTWPLLVLLALTLLELVPGLPAVRDRRTGAQPPDAVSGR